VRAGIDCYVAMGDFPGERHAHVQPTSLLKNGSTRECSVCNELIDLTKSDCVVPSKQWSNCHSSGLSENGGQETRKSGCDGNFQW
jgi:hypothetical protein